MTQLYYGCDAHKKFSVFVAMNERGEFGPATRVTHEKSAMREFLVSLPPGSQIALETSGSYYWLVDEMEAAGHEAKLGHALTAKRRMEGRHKTDLRDAQGAAMLLRNGTWPSVWIPPRQLRDERETMRLRMSLVRMRTQMKNRIHGVLMRYNVQLSQSDVYGRQGRLELTERCEELPEHSRQSVRQQLAVVDFLEMQIEDCEEQISAMLQPSVERDLLDTLPGVGKILSAVMTLEIGKVERFADGMHLASYAGLVPTAQESADKKRSSRCPKDSNVYLRWAFVEAANVVATKQQDWQDKHVVKLYQRVRRKTKLHAKATVAVGRHLAEAAFWMLSKLELYREPKGKVLSSTHG
jgi:transposase